MAATLSDTTGTIGESETLYDPMGRALAQTTYRTAGPTPLARLTPLARWRLNETSGTTAADSSGNSAATVNGTTWSTSHGGSATFNSNDTITTAGPVLDTSRSFTVSTWVYLTPTPGVDRVIAAQEGANAPSFKLQHAWATNRWSFATASADTASPTWSEARSNAVPATFTWVHLAGVYNGTAKTLTLYVNGVAQTTTASNVKPWKALGPFDIGHARGGTNLTDPSPTSRLYSKALSAAEVTAVYNGTSPAAGASVQRTSYTLDADGSVTSVTDPNGNVTTIINDEVGRPVETHAPQVSTVVEEDAPEPGIAMSRVGYNTFGEVVQTKDPIGNITVVHFDPVGRPHQVVSPPTRHRARRRRSCR